MPTLEAEKMFQAFVDDIPAPPRSNYVDQMRKPKALRPLLLAINECMQLAIKQSQRDNTIKLDTLQRMQSLHACLDNILTKSEEG